MVVADPTAPPIWARFYEIGTNRPFFCGRDGVKKYSLAEIEHERRIGYAWYTNAPAYLLDKEYPLWRSKYPQKKDEPPHARRVRSGSSSGLELGPRAC